MNLWPHTERTALFFLAVVASVTSVAAVSGCNTQTVERRVGGSDGGSGSGATGDATTGGASGGSGTGGTTAGTGSGSGSGTTTGTEDAVGTTGTSDTTVTTPPPLCGAFTPTGDPMYPYGKPVGFPCSAHAECATGYCYDEALWNEDGTQQHRFCTAACTQCEKTKCSDYPKPGPKLESNCAGTLSSSFRKHFSLRFKSLCLAKCTQDSDCAPLGGTFTKCAQLRFGKDFNYGVNKYCQPADFYTTPESEFK